jgi:lysophospholipase L1-like esterase
VLFTISGASAEGTVQAIPRSDPVSLRAHAELLAKRQGGVIDVFFEGDSITRRWGCSDPEYRTLLENWRKNFHGWNAANFAWGGDSVQNVLWSLEDGELRGVQPKVIVLLAGTNNLSEDLPSEREADKVAEVVAGIEEIVALMRREAPSATIIVTGILPRNGGDGSTRLIPVIDAINQRLATMADGRGIRYLNISRQLADRDGRLYAGVTSDGLHLTVPGYQIWADALKPILLELLGPPAAEDQAPPPTGIPPAAGG